ncbi:ABC transporter G family member 5 [Nymphaea thermarum]|nr:ABC transporter G family member 5 [Nymphaea thermarum]
MESVMKKGCEIEAKCINYKVDVEKTSHPFRIWSREEELSSPNPVDEEQKVGMVKRAKHVLKNVSCRARPWEILAIVGPSGAGKSSLLEILAGRIIPQTSNILVNQKPIDRILFKKISGYVTQKDTLFPLLTVEETLLFSARLKLKLPYSERVDKVESLIKELGLEHIAHSRIGNEKIRGISGGERRRVSIGVDVIHDPAVLLLDEPTSGLDSTSALQIIDMLKLMAEIHGRTVILSIHQPGFKIIKLFNSVLLLANGSVLHHGTTQQLQNHLVSAGLQIPMHVNIIEFAIDAVDDIRKQLPQYQYEEARNKGTLQQLFRLNKVVEGSFDEGGGFSSEWICANSRIKEIIILMERFAKSTFRTKELFAVRTLQMLIAGLVLGTIFHDLNRSITGQQERIGLFAFILTFLLSCTTEALPIFLQEREILMKEISSGSYRISSYVIANGLVFLPFLLILALLFSIPLYWLVGLTRSFSAFLYFVLIIWLVLYTANSVVACFSALASNFIIGNSVIAGVMGSFFLFSGYFISKDQIPRYWIFMHYISLFKYPFEAFMVNEFSSWKGCLGYKFGRCLMTGEDVLKGQGLGEADRWRSVMYMICFIVAYRFFSYIILRCRCSHGSLKQLLV